MSISVMYCPAKRAKNAPECTQKSILYRIVFTAVQRIDPEFSGADLHGFSRPDHCAFTHGCTLKAHLADSSSWVNSMRIYHVDRGKVDAISLSHVQESPPIRSMKTLNCSFMETRNYQECHKNIH